jgi:hypothetical protein
MEELVNILKDYSCGSVQPEDDSLDKECMQQVVVAAQSMRRSLEAELDMLREFLKRSSDRHQGLLTVVECLENAREYYALRALLGNFMNNTEITPDKEPTDNVERAEHIYRSLKREIARLRVFLEEVPGEWDDIRYGVTCFEVAASYYGLRKRYRAHQGGSGKPGLSPLLLSDLNGLDGTARLSASLAAACGSGEGAESMRDLAEQLRNYAPEMINRESELRSDNYLAWHTGGKRPLSLPKPNPHAPRRVRTTQSRLAFQEARQCAACVAQESPVCATRSCMCAPDGRGTNGAKCTVHL